MSGADWVSDLKAAVLEGDAERARELTEHVLDSGVAPEQVLDAGLVPAMTEAGRRFEDQRFFLPELMLTARAMKGALELIKPLLAERDVPPVGRVVIGTVAGDLHDIGKNIVAAMLEGGGFAVHDLGIDVTPAAFAAAAREHNADIVGLSALLTTTMPVMRQVVAELERAGVRDRVKVLVGGAPLTDAYAAEIGADAYAATAAAAVGMARRLLDAESAGPTAAARSRESPQVARPEPATRAPRRSDRGPLPAAALTSRELVKGALDFQAPARLPRQLWVLPWAAKRYPEELGRIERDFPPDITTIPVFCSEPVPGGGNAHTVGTFVDAWGCTFLNLQEGIIGQVKQPLVTDWSDTEHVRFPRERLAIDRREVTAFCEATDRFVLAGTCPRPFERLQFLRGPENLYLDLNRPSARLREFLQRLHAFYIEELTLWAETEVDALTFMDDWGSQTALLVAPELWREMFKPLYADYIAIAHEHGKYAFMHSDGYITEIIPDLIEIGLDALNSQVFCMDLEELGRRFAGQLTFWGELDRQQMLPRATTTEIAEAARRLQAAFHRDGGFIAQCEFGPGARPENVYAFFAACAGG
ncbi:MAG: cobalamin-dependent protein [Gemmatimonadales bacterium]|jgi:methylmalonyl-CoA mutase cobalamin-binding domain/chain